MAQIFMLYFSQKCKDGSTLENYYYNLLSQIKWGRPFDILIDVKSGLIKSNAYSQVKTHTHT